MKKIVITLIAAVALIGTVNAQNVGGYLAGKAAAAAKRAINSRVDKAVDNAMDSAANKALNKMGWTPLKGANADGTDPETLTPLDYMKKMPDFPAPGKVAEHKYYSEMANPPLLKLAANPTTAFATKTTVLMTSSSASVQGMSEERAEQLAKATEKQFEELYGITPEQAAEMSEEELQALIYQKTLENAGKIGMREDAMLKYMDGPLGELISKYSKFDDMVEALFDNAQNQSETIWKERFAAKGESAKLAFYQEIAPLFMKAAQEAQRIRMENQMPIAEEYDKKANELAVSNPETYADAASYVQLLLLSYFNDALTAIQLWTPSL